MNATFECWTCGNTTSQDWCNDCKVSRGAYSRGQRNLDNLNNVFNRYPHLQEDTRVDLRIFTPGSEIKIPWVCSECGNEWISAITNRTVSGAGCPECAKGKIWQVRKSNLPNDAFLQWGRPDLWEEVRDKEEAEQKQYLLGSDDKIWWVCKVCGREWEAHVYSRTGPLGTGCSSCSHKQSWKPGGGRDKQKNKENFLKNARPDLYEELVEHPHGDRVTIGSQLKATWRCKECAFIWKAPVCNRTAKEGTGCPYCHESGGVGTSRGEQEVLNFIKSIYQGEVIANDRSIGKEIDIYLPKLKIGVEFNGLYWHSEGKVGVESHREKLELLEREGIRLFVVWEDDWRDKRNLVKRKLRHLLGVSNGGLIGARNCYIDPKVPNIEARELLNNYHIQGFGSGGSVKVGLREKITGVLVAVAVFKTFEEAGVLYLERYVTGDRRVPGGFSRLMKWAEGVFSEKGYHRVITFADCAVSQGKLYEDTGFVLDGVLEPDYSYLVEGRRVHKFNYRKSRFREDTKLTWEEGLTEAELADLNGLRRVWDYGKKRYIYVFNSRTTGIA